MNFFDRFYIKFSSNPKEEETTNNDELKQHIADWEKHLPDIHLSYLEEYKLDCELYKIEPRLCGTFLSLDIQRRTSVENNLTQCLTAVNLNDVSNINLINGSPVSHDEDVLHFIQYNSGIRAYFNNSSFSRYCYSQGVYYAEGNTDGIEIYKSIPILHVGKAPKFARSDAIYFKGPEVYIYTPYGKGKEVVTKILNLINKKTDLMKDISSS